MADPLSIVSVIEGSLSLILQCGNVVKTLNDIAGKYKHAKLSILSMVQEVNTIELAWSRIRGWAQNHADNTSDTELFERLDRSLECGTLVMSALQQDLSEYTTAAMGFKLRSRAAWNEQALQDHPHRIRGQAIAMSLLLQVLELPIPKDRSGLLRTMASLLRTSDESAYSIAPSLASSRMSMSKDGTSSCISNARSDMNFRRLTCEDDLIVAKVYKRIQKKNLLRQLFQPKAKNASGGTHGGGVNIELVDQGKLPRHEHALVNLENVMLPPTCLPRNSSESISPLRLPASNGQRAHSDTIKVNESGLDAEAEFAVAKPLFNKTAILTTSHRQHVGQDHTTDAILTERPPSAQSLEPTRAANIQRPHRCIGTSSQLPLNETLISANMFEELLHVTGFSGRAGSSMISLRFLITYGEHIRNHLEQLELVCRSDGDQANTTGNPIMDSDSTSLTLKHEFDSNGDAGMGNKLRQLEVAYIAEHCSVGWDTATKALEKMGDRETAVQMLRGTMTPAALSLADAAEERILLRDWKALLALIELEFRSKTEMRSQIRLGKVPVIAYEDLCYVFRPGDIVLSSHGKRIQALAVLDIRNGQEYLFNHCQLQQAILQSFKLTERIWFVSQSPMIPMIL